MAIDINNKEAIKKLTLDDLINNAVERGDAEALNWLEKEANTKKTRTRADGTKYEVNKSIVEIRPEYLKKFLGYESKGRSTSAAAKARKKKEAQEKLNKKFADARAKLGK